MLQKAEDPQEPFILIWYHRRLRFFRLLSTILPRFSLVLCLGGAQDTLCARLRAHLCCCLSSFVENQTIEIVGQIGERQFGFGTGDADRADEKTVAVFLMGKDMLHG